MRIGYMCDLVRVTRFGSKGRDDPCKKLLITCMRMMITLDPLCPCLAIKYG